MILLTADSAVAQRLPGDVIPIHYDITVAPDLAALPTLLLWITGSRDHVHMLQLRARERGMVLAMDGLRCDGVPIAVGDEAAVDQRLGLPYRQPRQRER